TGVSIPPTSRTRITMNRNTRKAMCTTGSRINQAHAMRLANNLEMASRRNSAFQTAHVTATGVRKVFGETRSIPCSIRPPCSEQFQQEGQRVLYAWIRELAQGA